MKYCYSEDDESPFEGDCDTKEDAILEAFDEYPEADYIYVGVATKKTIKEYLNCYHVEQLLEDLNESADEECGEAVDDWLYKISIPERDSLVSLIGAALETWAFENDKQPLFWHVSEIEQVKKEAPL